MTVIDRILDNLPQVMMHSPDVPDDMRDGIEDEDGWCRWKPIPSTLSLGDIEKIEKELPGQLPTLFRKYLTHRHVLDLDFGWLTLMGVPSCNPIAAIRRWFFEMDKSQECIKNGYVIFGTDGEGLGYLCFDMNNPAKEDQNLDYPVILIEHGQGEINILRTISTSFVVLLEDIYKRLL